MRLLWLAAAGLYLLLRQPAEAAQSWVTLFPADWTLTPAREAALGSLRASRLRVAASEYAVPVAWLDEADVADGALAQAAAAVHNAVMSVPADALDVWSASQAQQVRAHMIQVARKRSSTGG